MTTFISSSPLAGEELKGRVEGNFRYGQERSITMTEFWVPFTQDDASVLYGDLRMMGDNQDNREGNLGVGYRKITDIAGIRGVAGVNGWLDRRITEHGSTFHQVTTGVEWLGKTVDVRANGYIPLSSEKTVTIPNADPQSATLAGTGVLIDTDGRLLEEPQHGFDLELGWELGQNFDFIKDNTDSFRIYGGGYYFDGDNTDKVAGWRTRAAVDISSDIQIGARFQRDAERGSQGFLEATVRFPFGQKKSYRKEGLRARLDESPERDIDIVTGAVVTDSGDRVQVLNQTTGQAQEILHVDNTVAGGGDGSVETPFNTLADAQAAASAHTVIYVHRGDGTTTNQNAGITLNKTGQQLIGSGSNFVFDSSRFTAANGSSPSSTLLIAATTAPVITNGGGDGVTIAASDIMVAGITVDGATNNGLDIDDADNLQIQNITIQNSTSDGINALYNSAGATHSLTLDNVTLDGNGSRGAYIQSSSDTVLNLSILGSTSMNNTDNGLRITATGTSQITANIDSFLSDNDASRSLYLTASTSGTLNATVTNSTFQNNVTGIQRGIQIQATNDGTTNITLENNIVQNNGHRGIFVTASDDAVSNTWITGNQVLNNGEAGIYLKSDDDTTVTSTVKSNTVTGNATHGLQHVQTGNSVQSTMLQTNTVRGNAGSGLFINNDSTSLATVDAGGGALGSLGQNRIFSNTSSEVFIDLNGGTLAAKNNWWGVSTGLDPTEVNLDDGAINASNFLTTDPEL